MTGPLRIPDSFVLRRFREACQWAGVADADLQLLLSRFREHRVVALRDAVTWHMRQPDTLGRFCSYPQIAAAFGRDCHSTFIVMHQRYLREHPEPEPVFIPVGSRLVPEPARA